MTAAADSTSVTVYKLNEDGQEVWRYPGRLIALDEASIQIEAFFNRDDYDLGYTTFKRGDRFVETFYSNRWYNVFAVYDRDLGELKGWYCNICRPSRWSLDTEASEWGLWCDDLALDLWVSPFGETLVLDEDEFEQLELNQKERTQARSALQELLMLAAQQQLPQ